MDTGSTPRRILDVECDVGALSEVGATTAAAVDPATAGAVGPGPLVAGPVVAVPVAVGPVDPWPALGRQECKPIVTRCRGASFYKS